MKPNKCPRCFSPFELGIASMEMSGFFGYFWVCLKCKLIISQLDPTDLLAYKNRVDVARVQGRTGV